MTMKEAFAKAQGYEVEYNLYDEYLYEIRKKYDCERSRIYAQYGLKDESAWDNIKKKVSV